MSVENLIEKIDCDRYIDHVIARVGNASGV